MKHPSNKIQQSVRVAFFLPKKVLKSSMKPPMKHTHKKSLHFLGSSPLGRPLWAGKFRPESTTLDLFSNVIWDSWLTAASSWHSVRGTKGSVVRVRNSGWDKWSWWMLFFELVFHRNLRVPRMPPPTNKSVLRDYQTSLFLNKALLELYFESVWTSCGKSIIPSHAIWGLLCWYSFLGGVLGGIRDILCIPPMIAFPGDFKKREWRKNV